MKKTFIFAFALLASLLALSSCNKKSDSEKDDDANKTKIVLEIDESDLGHPVTNADAKSAANAIRNRLRGLDLKNLKVTTGDSKHIVVTTTDSENIESAIDLAQRSTYVAFCPTFFKSDINFKPVLYYIDSIGTDPQAQAARKLITNEGNGYGILGYVKSEAEFDVIASFFERPEVRILLPEDLHFGRSYKKSGHDGYEVYMLNCPSDHYNMLFATDISSVEVGDDPQLGSVINMQFNDEASREWEKITRRNLGRLIAIVMDNEVICAPFVSDVIFGGKTQIASNFTRKEAMAMAAEIKNGSFNARLKVVSVDRPK